MAWAHLSVVCYCVRSQSLQAIDICTCKRLIFVLDTQDGDVSDHADVLDSIVKASELPISIVVAGLKGPVSGDGWC